MLLPQSASRSNPFPIQLRPEFAERQADQGGVPGRLQAKKGLQQGVLQLWQDGSLRPRVPLLPPRYLPPYPDGRSRHRRYSRSRSEDSDRHKKPKRRHRSDSSDRGRSRSPKSKKDRKNRSRDRDERKSKKKHKKSRSSDS